MKKILIALLILFSAGSVCFASSPEEDEATFSSDNGPFEEKKGYKTSTPLSITPHKKVHTRKTSDSAPLEKTPFCTSFSVGRPVEKYVHDEGTGKVKRRIGKPTFLLHWEELQKEAKKTEKTKSPSSSSEDEEEKKEVKTYIEDFPKNSNPPKDSESTSDKEDTDEGSPDNDLLFFLEIKKKKES